MHEIALYTDSSGTVVRQIDEPTEAQADRADAVVMSDDLPDLQSMTTNPGEGTAYGLSDGGILGVKVVEKWLSRDELEDLAEAGQLAPLIESGRFSEDSLIELDLEEYVDLLPPQ